MEEFLTWLDYYASLGRVTTHAEPPLAWALTRLASNLSTYGTFSPEGR